MGGGGGGSRYGFSHQRFQFKSCTGTTTSEWKEVFVMIRSRPMHGKPD